MAWVESRGSRHRGCYRDLTGKKQYTPWGSGKRAAKQAAEEEEAKLRAGTWVDPNAGKITFSTYFEQEWLPNRVIEKNTEAFHRSNYNASLKAKFGDMELRKITTGVVQRWVADMARSGTSARVIEARFTTLQATLAAQKGVSARRDGLIATNPCEGVTLPTAPPRKVDIYSVEECDQIIAALDPWWRPLPLFDSATAMRWGELMGLWVSDFTKDFAEVEVQRTVIELTKEATGNGTPFMYKEWPKGKKTRKFRLDPEASQLIRQLVKARQLFPGDRVFSMPGKDGLPDRTEAWPEGRPISRSYHRQFVWKPVHEKTGIRPRRLHDLRGSNISWMLAGGADISAVMERVGHTQWATTQVYWDALRDADERALDALAVTRQRARNKQAQ